jgi:putative transposase
MPMLASAPDLILMRVVDELHLEYPSLGLRRLTKMLERRGRAVGGCHVGTWMERM